MSVVLLFSLVISFYSVSPLCLFICFFSVVPNADTTHVSNPTASSAINEWAFMSVPSWTMTITTFVLTGKTGLIVVTLPVSSLEVKFNSH